MRIRVPGPSVVLGRAVAAADALETALGLVPRAAEAMNRVEALLDPAEVTAAITLVDRMPLVLEHLENDVLPMLSTLERVGPDVHELLEVADDLRRVITGLPGIGLLRRRGEDEPPPVEGSVHEGTADTTEA